MLTYLKGDLFSSPAQVLVNAVNTVGVMGKGVALEFKKRYPEMFAQYQKMCGDGSFEIGKLFLWKSTEKWVLLFPTKQHWRNPSKVEYIEKGLQKFVDNWQRLGIESIAFPRLGCGNGGLDWELVRPIIERFLKPLPIKIYIYVDQYQDAPPEHQQPDIIAKWIHNEPKALSFNMLKEDLQQLIAQENLVGFSDGSLRKVRWERDVLTITNGEEVTITDQEFCNVWDYVRGSGVFTVESIPEHLSAHPIVIIELLKKLDYLQDVIISKNGVDFGSTGNGYQYT